MTPNIRDALAWSNSHHSDLIQQWRVQHTVGFLSEYNAITKLEGERVSRLLERTANLSAHSFLRVFKAPETFWRTLRCAKNDRRGYLRFLENSIEVERCLAGNQYRLPRSTWSALGDARVSDSHVWTGTSHICSRSRDFNIIIDGCSPYARRPFINRRTSEITIGPAGKPTAFQQSLVFDKISESLDAIDAISEGVSDFVYQNISAIVPYHDISNPRHFTSASTNRFIGQMMLVNPHLQSASIPFIVNALVHESVHSYLYAIELRHALLTERAPQSVFLASPWTGTLLTLHSYIHACFVWHALRSFWELDSAQSFFGNTSDFYATTARAGFVSNEFKKRLTPYKKALNASTMEEIMSLSI